ncbi:MAG: response regulator [Bryobacteraceae bacterium]|nr:response regulator [Bryobacteraceae bacterium]
MDRADLEQWRPKEVARLLALVETERNYHQQIVASVPVGLLVVDADLTIISANRYIRKLFGLRGEDVLRRRVEDVLPIAGLGERVSEVLSTYKPRERQAVTVKVTTSDGTREVTGLLGLQPLQGWELDAGQEVLVTFQDLTSVGTGLTALPAPIDVVAEKVAPVPVPVAPVQVAPLSSIVNDIDAVVWEADPITMRCQFVSERAEELLGYPLTAWQEEGFWRNKVHDEDRERVVAFYRHARETGTSHACEYQAIASTGAVIWVREIVRVQRDEHGQALKFTGITLDVGSRRSSEEQAGQSQKVEALGRLAAKVAHDFNNLLMIISGYGEELKSSLPPSSPLRNDMQEILQAAERVSVLTGQLQQYTKKIVLEPKLVDLNQLVKRLEPVLKRQLGDGVQLRIDAQADAATAKVDPAQLESAILHLASHAKYGMRGLGRLTISTADLELDQDYGEAAHGGSYILVSITDNGPGMDEENRARLFEPWMANEESLREERLLVTQAYNIVRQSGGDLAVSSQPGEGTAFRIYLPSAGQASVTAPAPAPSLVPPMPEPPVLAPEAEAESALETILVVEDEAGIRALVRKILRRQGYSVLEASNGDDALKICAGHKGKIDLLVTDVMMPRMSGRELADRLTALRPELRVLYVSGYTDDAMLSSGSFPAGTAFLQKPFTLGSLLGKVREVLDIGQSRRAAN